MNTDIFVALLSKVESDTLDYKREQYRFVGASDQEKSEFLKDILMFANGWRTSNAFILVGVEEKSVPPHAAVGITEHLKDNDIQQFVNSKTNVPVAFRVESLTYDGKEFDIITFHTQQRPVFLRNDFGKLRRNITYVRRGTSCAEADPTEVGRMARNLKVSISPTRNGKQQLAHIRLFNSGPGPILIESWWMQWGPEGRKGGNESLRTVKGKLPARIDEQNTAELLVEIGDNLEELSGLGVCDGDHHRWPADVSQLEVFKHQAIAHRLPPLPSDEKEKEEKTRELAALKECKVEVEVRVNSSAPRKRLEVQFKNRGNVTIPITKVKLSWEYTPPRWQPSQPGKPKVAEAGGSVDFDLRSPSKLIKPGDEAFLVLGDDFSSLLVELLRGDVRDEDIKIEVGTSLGSGWIATMEEIPGAVKEVAQSALEHLHRQQ